MPDDRDDSPVAKTCVANEDVGMPQKGILESNGRGYGSLYICAPLNALVAGIYEENIHLDEIVSHGDFGIGTFDDLDGEMVIVDRVVYQLAIDGRAIKMAGPVMTPYAAVTFFNPVIQADLDNEMQYVRFLEWLNNLLPSPNIFYAIRIDGEFSRVRAHSVPRQANHRPMVEVEAEQRSFHFENIQGTLAGIYTPDFMSTLSFPGHHLHFLSADLQTGGHLVSCTPRRVRARIQLIHRLELNMPMTRDYLKLNFHGEPDHNRVQPGK
jgi:acetolactate decarboxylase